MFDRDWIKYWKQVREEFDPNDGDNCCKRRIEDGYGIRAVIEPDEDPLIKFGKGPCIARVPSSAPTSAQTAQSLIINSIFFWQPVDMKWIIDLEGYQLDGIWFPKEIALLNVETQECTCLIIKLEVAYRFVSRDYYRTIGFQFKRHRLRWDEGDYNLATAMEKFRDMVHAQDIVYCKGDQKVKYFKSWFDQVEEVNAPAFKTLDKFPSKYCDRKHGLICAKRKCFELIEYV